jgi:hypothetical protein
MVETLKLSKLDLKYKSKVGHFCQCRVLIQIIGGTITAIKLASCPNWAEIFFDLTTHRQVPFSAVFISLMGNKPNTIDPIIISPCVILED